MKVSYDHEVDAISIIFRETTTTTKTLGEGIAVEYARHGRLAGIEVLDAVKRFGDAESLRHVIVEGIVPGTASRRRGMAVMGKHAGYGTQKTARIPRGCKPPRAYGLLAPAMISMKDQSTYLHKPISRFSSAIRISLRARRASGTGFPYRSRPRSRLG